MQSEIASQIFSRVHIEKNIGHLRCIGSSLLTLTALS